MNTHMIQKILSKNSSLKMTFKKDCVSIILNYHENENIDLK